MTNEEAKFILSAYRPGGGDAADPAFAAALTQAQQDPALGTWFAQQQRHGAAVAARLREIVPPAGLREAILAGARASGRPSVRAWWTRPSLLAAAASVLVLFGVAGTMWWRSPSMQLGRLEAFAVDDTLHARHGSHGEAVSALGTVLSQPDTHLGGTLPVDFAALRTTGCRTINFAGHDVVELCFTRGGAEFHFYVLQQADFPRLPASGAIDFGQREGMAFASWTDAAHRYVAVSAAGLGAIRQLL
ncbi:MAG TPA: hypothetical protein VG838_02300 [Opitutaceae bacterium]|nr:hypothetical protein [Opitutaceae bacterium]